MNRFKGRPVSPGFARDCTHVYGMVQVPIPRYRINVTMTADKRLRFGNALQLSAEDIARLQQHVEAEIERSGTICTITVNSHKASELAAACNWYGRRCYPQVGTGSLDCCIELKGFY
jgi:phosphoenolpyruvate-protein kinase (PTS system EI component)